jgi:hypothetical protein
MEYWLIKKRESDEGLKDTLDDIRFENSVRDPLAHTNLFEHAGELTCCFHSMNIARTTRLLV